MRVGRRGRAATTRGFTYLWVLFAVALAGIALVASSAVWGKVAAREKREQFAWAGEQYRRAIGSYYESSPGGAKVFARTFEDLLQDARFPNPRRHLRALYLDPFTGTSWEAIRGADGGIRGVRGQWDDGENASAVKEFIYVPDATS